MSSNSSSLDLVSNFTCLTSKHNHEEAMRLLKNVATMVRPIMKAHGWKITTLAEFYSKGLLGMNTNRGWKIQLCLRYHNDENTFLPWEDILGTMLHELAHNIRGPHDQQFYKALDDLNDEYDKVVASGYTGEGFDTAGRRLGTKHGGFGPGGVRLGGAIGADLVRIITFLCEFTKLESVVDIIQSKNATNCNIIHCWFKLRIIDNYFGLPHSTSN
ncbi:hypothetical protein KI688_001947 [Linnemannia hyalina]|uniref:WLM domain-containing protein n=1 Tax=Linnemannia hyalina TaxID=64524 RepID=A0A9P7XS69_9FUNG|nr:hypothetical protein KI688_001947 [Linnemannia hyalina]